jgi:predicted nucleotidyltransferase
MKGKRFRLKSVTKKSTIVPDMSTTAENNNLSSVLFGKTRRAILSLLYSHTDEAFYLRQIVKATGAGLGAVQREVSQLSGVGIISRIVRGQHVYFQANQESPIFNELKSLVVKTVGIGDILRNALAPLTDRINIAFTYGSFARGDEQRSSDLDILVVGKVTFAEVVSAFRQAQEKLVREINPTVYPPEEFQSKLKSGHHFLKTVLKGKKIFLIGDERELERLAQKRLAG